MRTKLYPLAKKVPFLVLYNWSRQEFKFADQEKNSLYRKHKKTEIKHCALAFKLLWLTFYNFGTTVKQNISQDHVATANRKRILNQF